VLDGRDAMVAVGMNGQPLPVKHGFPARMIVPGLYGYVSATKWLSRIELTTLDAYDAYWVQRGWAKQAPIKLMSRIDTPRDGQGVAAGTVPIAGVAWAPHKGVQGVEVQIDPDPTWHPARLADVPSTDTWRLWVVQANVPAGQHTARVRAIDNSGMVQDGNYTDPAPDGATGWHEITFVAR
jgi:DMSO/TMAO reductase YedYZ molybdopterin-dependent catalytic subunit